MHSSDAVNQQLQGMIQIWYNRMYEIELGTRGNCGRARDAQLRCNSGEDVTTTPVSSEVDSFCQVAQLSEWVNSCPIRIVLRSKPKTLNPKPRTLNPNFGVKPRFFHSTSPTACDIEQENADNPEGGTKFGSCPGAKKKFNEKSVPNRPYFRMECLGSEPKVAKTN